MNILNDISHETYNFYGASGCLFEEDRGGNIRISIPNITRYTWEALDDFMITENSDSNN